MVAPLRQRRRGVGPRMGTFDLFDELHRELGRFFGEPLEQAITGMQGMPVNMAGDENGLSLSFELPGYTRQDVTLDLEGRVLTVRAERAAPEADKAEAAEAPTYVMRQRSRGTMSRTLELPFEIEADAVKARMENGVLLVELPRRESTKPRKIAIEG